MLKAHNLAGIWRHRLALINLQPNKTIQADRSLCHWHRSTQYFQYLRNNKHPLQIKSLSFLATTWNWRITAKSLHSYLWPEPLERLAARQYPLLEDFAVDRGELGVFKETTALSAASLDLIVIFVPLFIRHPEKKSPQPMQNFTKANKRMNCSRAERTLLVMNNA